MEFINSPTNNISNENENLIFQSSPDGQQNVDINQFFTEKKYQSSDGNNRFVIKYFFLVYIGFFLLLLVFLITPIPIIIFIPMSGLSIHSRILIVLIGILLELILLIYCHKKIVLLKDESNKKLLIKVINFLCCDIKKINLDLENIHFYVETLGFTGEETNNLFIINDFKNLADIDLDESNIKQKPAKFLYSFKSISLGKYKKSSDLSDVLNNFVGSPRDYKNPLFFKIKEYIKKEQKYNVSGVFSSYLKFNEHFFSYDVIKGLRLDLTYGCFMKFIFFINLLIIIGAVILFIDGIDIMIRLLGVIVLLIVDILSFILYKIFKHYYDNICRIDIIYSKNYDRIFIGLVKQFSEKYINTFEYQMNNISRFILEKELNNSNISFNLKVVLKNNETQQICNLKNKTQKDLEGLAYILNERLIITTNIDFNEKK